MRSSAKLSVNQFGKAHERFCAILHRTLQVLVDDGTDLMLAILDGHGQGSLAFGLYDGEGVNSLSEEFAHSHGVILLHCHHQGAHSRELLALTLVSIVPTLLWQ